MPNLGLNDVYGYKLGKSKEFLKITLIGLGAIKEKAYKEGIYLKLAESTMEILCNKTTEFSHANSVKILGSTSELFGKFRELNWDRDFKDFQELYEAWKEYYDKVMPGAIDKASEVYGNAFIKWYQDVNWAVEEREISEDIAKKYKQAGRDYLEHLVYYQTCVGMYLEIVFFNTISKATGYRFRKSNLAEERKGIDGYLGEIPFSIKPNSFKEQNSPVSGVLVKYKKNNDNYEFVVCNEETSGLMKSILNDSLSRQKISQ